MVSYKVVAYRKWSLARSGRQERVNVDCISAPRLLRMGRIYMDSGETELEKFRLNFQVFASRRFDFNGPILFIKVVRCSKIMLWMG